MINRLRVRRSKRSHRPPAFNGHLYRGGAGAGGGSSVPNTTAVTLAAVAQYIWQRVKTTNNANVTFAGTYTGAAPTNLEGQVLLDDGTTIVVDWTSLTGSVIGAGAYTGTLSTPYGPLGTGAAGSKAIANNYTRKVRCLGKPSVTNSDSTAFFVGRWVLMYGQSNMAFMSTQSASPPAAALGTSYYDGSDFVSVPAGNGVRIFLNSMVAADGIPTAAFNEGHAGAGLYALLPGDASGYYTTLAAHLATIGDAELTIFAQGENDANTQTLEATYLSELSTLHDALAASAGRTLAQMPLVSSGIGNKTVPGEGTDIWWDLYYRIAMDEATLSNVYYSHSNIDVTRTDEYHYDAASMGRAGARFAYAAGTDVYGLNSGKVPNWSINSAVVVDGTHTTVDLTHSMGTDFTPTSGITGFELSGDNGASWAAASAGVRTSATRITLTHGALSTTNARLVRYMYGRSPDISGAVHDNGALAVPLNPSAGVIHPTPLSYVPLANYLGDMTFSTISGSSGTISSIPIGAATASRFVIFGIIQGQNDASLTGATIKVSGQADIPATLNKVAIGVSGGQRMLAIISALVPYGTSCDLDVTYGAGIFSAGTLFTWTADSTLLASTTPTDAKSSIANAAASTSVNLATTSGGFIIVMSVNFDFPVVAGGTISGGETYAQLFTTGNGRIAVASAIQVGTSGSNTVTATYNSAADLGLVAVAWH